MKISVITPSYNQGKFLERTINSVLNQEVLNLEYIVFDGGSTDESVQILKKYSDHLTFFSEKDEGQADAVNKGIEKANGDIIAWINSDDIYFPGALQTVIEVFENNPEVDVVYGLAEHIDEFDEYIEDYYTERWDFKKLQEVCYLCQPAVFFRKKVCYQYGLLQKNLRYCMDYEYWLRIGQEKPFFFLNKKLAGSRLYLTNKTLGNRRGVHEEIIMMIKEKFGKVPTKWIYNLAHIITEDKGFNRNEKKENYKFVRNLVIVSSILLFKYQKKITKMQMKELSGWYKHSRREYLEVKNENRI